MTELLAGGTNPELDPEWWAYLIILGPAVFTITVIIIALFNLSRIVDGWLSVFAQANRNIRGKWRRVNEELDREHSSSSRLRHPSTYKSVKSS